jgi:small subunit ribosomal protein S20
MPNSKQASKRLRQSETRRQENKAVTSRMRTAFKKFLKTESASDARAQLSDAMKRVDKAAKKGVIHKNAAARKKRQLQNKLASLR